MDEMVSFWIENFRNSGLSVPDEIEDVKGTISNERLWMIGSDTEEQKLMHEQNIARLTEYLEWLEEQ